LFYFVEAALTPEILLCVGSRYMRRARPVPPLPDPTPSSSSQRARPSLNAGAMSESVEES
jgi:hypothetical protein